jgi:hypothetical protein
MSEDLPVYEPQSGQNNNGGAESAAGKRAARTQRRPSSLLRERGLRFVNKMRNVGWLAGYSQPGDDRSFLLQQTNNIEQALRIEVSERHAKLTRLAGRPLLVMVHVRGYRDEHGPQIGLHCVEMNKPSLLDLPIEEVWASGFGQNKEATKILSRLSRSNFSPFDDKGEIRPEYHQYIVSADAGTGEYELDDRAKNFLQAHSMLGEVLEASGGVIDSRLDRGQNYLSVAGFIDSKAWIPATEHRREYALLMLRQHEDSERNIPVRVVGKMAKAYFQKVREGSPVLIEGSARRKVIPDDQDTTKIKSRHSYIEATRVSPAQVEQDILTPLPEWWSQIRDRLIAERSARLAERDRQRAAAPKDALEAIGDEI